MVCCIYLFRQENLLRLQLIHKPTYLALDVMFFDFRVLYPYTSHSIHLRTISVLSGDRSRVVGMKFR